MSVDLPMPGSPPTSTAEARAMPPPKTRSSSGTPVVWRGGGGSAEPSGEKSTLATRVLAPEAGAARPPGAPTASSTRVFHAPHASQRPDHLPWAAPQDWQTKAVVDLAIWIARIGQQGGRPRRPREMLHDRRGPVALGA